MTYDPSPITPAPGQAMVEMALVIGILLLVILGGIDVLQVQMTQYTMSQAVWAAAHQAALIGVTNSRMATITVMCARKPCRRYDPITVRITYQDAIWAPIGPFQLVKVDLSATRLAEKDAQ